MGTAALGRAMLGRAMLGRAMLGRAMLGRAMLGLAMLGALGIAGGCAESVVEPDRNPPTVETPPPSGLEQNPARPQHVRPHRPD